jgi:4-hydroxybenzoate polyprenyltransferase/phosphoserine phosphatase
MNQPQVALVVDLDDTLIRTDLLLESALAALKTAPLRTLAAFASLRHGKARLKARLAALVDLRADLLPYNEQVLEFVRSRRAEGVPVVLATASNAKYAHAVAEHLGLFDAVCASSEEINLSGPRKAAQLVERFGKAGFDYAADARKDLPVWRESREAIAVDASARTLAALAAVGIPKQTIQTPGRSGKGRRTALLKALRPHQWAKNSLVFLPIFAAQMLSDLDAVAASLFAFVGFSLTASAGYIVNDLLDLEADRAHPRKRRRPFASGALPIRTGVVLVPALILAGLVPAMLLSAPLAGILLLYLAMTLSYSLYLKRKPTIDVLTLASLYTLRVIGGTVAVGVEPSFWLLAFSMFLFLSLAYVKRYAELHSFQQEGERWPSGRGYCADDLPLVQTLGVAAGYGAVLVLALYINSPQIHELYNHPNLIWLICPILLYWIVRIWTIAHRGLMHDDPLVFALENRISLLTIGAAGAVVLLAI